MVQGAVILLYVKYHFSIDDNIILTNNKHLVMFKTN